MRRMLLVASLVSLCAAFSPAASFRRGDVNQDGKYDIADAIKALSYLFSSEPSTCHDAIDVNDDGKVDIADPIKLLSHLFAGDLYIPPPFPDCGNDPTTGDLLTCIAYSGSGCATLAVASVTPTSGPAAGGTALVITGEGFLGGSLTATLCGKPLASLNVVNDTRLEGVTPSGTAGAVCDLTVTTSQGSATLANAFTYATPVLRIGGIAPSSGPAAGGTTVVITGEGFLGGNLTATLCSIPLTGIRILSDTRVEGLTPAGTAGAVCSLKITTTQGSVTLSNAFTYEELPPPDCYSDAELKALMAEQLGAPICLPSPAWEGDVLFWHVVACPVDRAGTCDDGTLGCEATIDSIAPVIDYENGKAQADITGHAALPVDLGSDDCTANITLAARASMDVILEDTQWPGIRRVVDVRNLAIQVTGFTLDASGGGMCGSLDLAESTMRDTLQDELDARAPEFEAQIEEALVGQYLCP